MNDKLDYYKEFWMFRKAENIYNGKNPSGYVKIEIKEKIGHISLFISHISNDKDYKVYLIRKDNITFKSIFIGKLLMSKNIGILSYKFNPFNVDNKGYDITKYNVVAIVQIAQNEHDITINQIAAAYKNKEVIWLKDLRCELLNKSKANIFCPIKSSLIPNMFSIELFKKQMDTNFKRCNPFFNERQDYIWWHIFNAYKLWYILKVFGIELKSPIVNSMILGIYENDKTSQCYIVLGYLINNQCKDLFDKVVEVYNERFKIKLKYGLNFIKPYEKQQAN